MMELNSAVPQFFRQSRHTSPINARQRRDPSKLPARAIHLPLTIAFRFFPNASFYISPIWTRLLLFLLPLPSTPCREFFNFAPAIRQRIPPRSVTSCLKFRVMNPRRAITRRSLMKKGRCEEIRSVFALRKQKMMN